LLPETYPDVDEVVRVLCLTEWLLLQRLKLFDVVWDLHANGRLCPHCAIPQIKQDLAIDQENYYDHGTLLEVQCDSAGIPRCNDGPAITPPRDVVDIVDGLGLPSRFIAIHCTSSDPVRDWPEYKWRKLIDYMCGMLALSVVEVGSKQLVTPHDTDFQRSLCGKLTMTETAEVLRRADLFIGVDSGPAHLANAVATPGVILLGKYRRFWNYMPYNGAFAMATHADMVRADGPAADIPVDAVLQIVINRLANAALQGLNSGTPQVRFGPETDLVAARQ
jgi:heptosyltransferase-3